MSRTDSLPEARGINKLVRPLRYHEASRQWFAVVYVLLVAYSSRPTMEMLIAGGFVVLIGTLVRLWASGHVKKNEVLATDGPYAHVRHPLYVGNILILLGFSIASMLWWAWALMVFLIWFYYPPAISYEDAKLRDFFGEQWENWRRNTRALIPTFGSSTGKGSSEWSFKQSLFRNVEPLIVIYIFVCLYLVYTRL